VPGTFPGDWLLEILFGWSDMARGIENDPAITISATGRTPAEIKARDPLIYHAMDQQQKAIGQGLLMAGVLLSIVSLSAFRRGARWAWFTFWLIPVITSFTAVSSFNYRQPDQSLAPPFYSGSLVTVLTIVWLVLSYRKYSKGEGEEAKSIGIVTS